MSDVLRHFHTLPVTRARSANLTERTTSPPKPTVRLGQRELRTMDLGPEGIRSVINVYGETAVVRSCLCQTACSTGPTRKTQDAVPVSATAVRIAKAQ